MMLKLAQLINKEDNRNFIQQNLTKDSSSLLLKYAKDDEKKLLIEQIAARQKTRKKLPDFYNNLELILPPSENLEQCTSTELASFKSSLINDYQSFTDLTSGLGIDFFHFARKAMESTYVEPNAYLFSIAQHNFKQLNLNHQSFNAKAEDVLEQLGFQDLIYMDPSRRDGVNAKIVRLEEYLPSIFELYSTLAKKCKRLIIKCSPLLEWRSYLSKLPHCEELWILSQRNDCKEICFVLNFSVEPSNINLRIKTYNLQDTDVQIFINKYPTAVESKFGPIASFLYMPNSSIMKAGIMDSLAAEFDLKKLAANTNIYSSEILKPSFPGRIWSVNQIHKPYAKELKGSQFNVVSRNFFDKASVIEKKLKIKSGGSKYLIALSTNDSSYFVEATITN